MTRASKLYEAEIRLPFGSLGKLKPPEDEWWDGPPILEAIVGRLRNRGYEMTLPRVDLPFCHSASTNMGKLRLRLYLQQLSDGEQWSRHRIDASGIVRTSFFRRLIRAPKVQWEEVKEVNEFLDALDAEVVATMNFVGGEVTQRQRGNELRREPKGTLGL